MWRIEIKRAKLCTCLELEILFLKNLRESQSVNNVKGNCEKMFAVGEEPSITSPHCGHVTVLPAKMIICFTEPLYHKSSNS